MQYQSGWESQALVCAQHVNTELESVAAGIVNELMRQYPRYTKSMSRKGSRKL